MSGTSFAAATDSLYEHGKNNQLQKKYELAILQFTRFLEANPRHLDALARLGSCLVATARPQRALTAYRQALRLAQGHPEILVGIANCYKDLGQFAKAIDYYEKALKAEPGKIAALYNLTVIRDYPLAAPLVQELHQRHDRLSATDASRVPVCFALAKVYETNGQYRKAFGYYEEGNRLQFSRVVYREKEWFAYFEAIEAFFNADLFARLRHVGCPDATPIFIVGMPRSGSTLVEQILASHAQVYGGGELDIMLRLAESVIPQMTGLPYPQAAINHMGQRAFAEIRELYLRELRSYCPKDRPRITDKTLRNYFQLGLIRLLFPRAVIIHCVRDPMDTCWSMYRQHFAGDHPYCYDQTALGRFYCRYRRLMRHWHRVLPGDIHDLHYERLVMKPEATIRSVLHACGLPWEKNCLTFYRTQRPITTISMRQVRRPIYTTSIRSWEPVEDGLGPLLAALEPCYAGG